MSGRAGRREILARALLVVLLAAETPGQALRESPARLSVAAASIGGPTGASAGFWFDPAYATFVEAVRRRTPEGATIALVVPPTTDLYVYRAVYHLVPRRVVPAEDSGSADYVAVYGGELGRRTGERVPGGWLLKR